MKHSHHAKVNKVILQSIPVKRKVKQYWVNKYKRIAENCGVDEAQRKMKHLRVTLMSYIADQHRGSNLQDYLDRTGFRQNGMLKALFHYADCQPHFVLSLLKLYTSDNKTTMTVDQAAFATKERLESVVSRVDPPLDIQFWFDILSLPERDLMKYYWKLRKDPRVKNFYGSKMANHHTLQEWMHYWKKWKSILRKGWTSPSKGDDKLVFPEVYKDYEADPLSSNSYRADFADLVSMHMNEYDCPLTRQELDFVDGFLDEEIADELFSLLWGENPSYSGLFTETSILSGIYVGHVHHIKKKGGGTELRDIAVPNRFIQMALAPGAAQLYALLKHLPNDATFNQDKFDTKIQNRVNNENLYQGSVDLSKATDNLPFIWGWYCVERLNEVFGSPPDEVMKSLLLFKTVARAKWEDEGYLLEWTVGQPLGSLPSFGMLGLTHNLWLESISVRLGLIHSPYSILGDDLEVFNKKLRKEYIFQMTRRRIPLSLHKSFDGRLAEFAGKIYVKNCIPFYSSDHAPISWNSLFDWQSATGIRIPWDKLPSKLRRHITQMCRKELERYPEEKFDYNEMASKAYSAAQACLVPGRGSVQYPMDMTAELSVFFEYMYSKMDEPPVEGLKHTGITMIGNGHPVVLMNSKFADKNGYFNRFRPVELPQWYKDKFRPCATDIAIRAGLSSHLGHCLPIKN